jgi:endonuclease G, mitochondrial
MKKICFILLLVFCWGILSAQTIKTIKTDIFTVTYSEIYQQPLELSYSVQCPLGDADRAGMDFKSYPGVITSDNDDYKNNIWDKGHLAPAADFNCTDSMLRGTFSYLNCALQHEGLNRGPWKELERFERDLAKVYAFISITIICHFEDKPQNWLPTGALVPVGFTKIIWCDGEKFEFYFPNADVAGQDWITFKIK